MNIQTCKFYTYKCTYNWVYIYLGNRISRNPPKRKPSMVHEYNKYMLGVDRMDQMTAYYSFQWKSIKWWRKVFFWLLEVIVNNAHILYKSHTNARRKLTLKEFRRELSVFLCQVITPDVLPGYQHQDQSLERLRGRHFPEKTTKRRDCRVCSDRNPGGETQLVKTVCGTCSDKPPLCIGCFHVYRTKSSF